MTDYTRSEINAQPAIWREWAGPLASRADEIRIWSDKRDHGEIWFSGAGTSAYIGDSLVRILSPRQQRQFLSMPTTDLVSCPHLFNGRAGSALSVQFGRSGNSSESVGLLDLLDAHRPDIDRLSITCNAESALALRQVPGPGESRSITLPPETHDRGFAMTSSFTTMLLSALACFDNDFDAAATLPKLADAAEAVLPGLWDMHAPRPARVIFLGSGALTAIARESALKVLELTAGATMTQWDSCLGFRHGPKAAVNDDTAVYVMIHPDLQTSRYDLDLTAEIRQQFPSVPVTTIGPAGSDIGLNLTGGPADCVLYVLAAQVLAHRWSQSLGLRVDDPFAGRNLTRVVSGVQLYGWQP